MDLSPYTSKNWLNANIGSNIPDICKNEPCMLGVDEAGRGPVLGPMVYGICYCPISKQEDYKNIGAVDSKVLNPSQREDLFHLIDKTSDYVGWAIEVLSPNHISSCMYKRPKMSLNEVSQNSAVGLIKRIMNAGVKIEEIYVDTLGRYPEKYQATLEGIFPTLKVTVAVKADSLFPIVSGASICAKVARDHALQGWNFPEGIEVDEWGSGYPGDPVTKKFLNNSIEPVFGFPSIVRFSWSTADKILEQKCVEVAWKDYDETGTEDEKKENTPSVLQYFAKKPKSPRKLAATKKRHHFFTERCLENVENF